MGVKGGQHPFDGALDNLFRIYFFNIVFFENTQYIGEDFKIFIGSFRVVCRIGRFRQEKEAE